ncbi:hypothetical protein ACGIF2_09155 [Cellulomonas sp. P22]|uniref:hypothetical protein n=1 Tax=Cellulomonas sp. P22 TaxID=3373189 RepID=UPI0037AA7958
MSTPDPEQPRTPTSDPDAAPATSEPGARWDAVVPSDTGTGVRGVAPTPGTTPVGPVRSGDDQGGRASSHAGPAPTPFPEPPPAGGVGFGGHVLGVVAGLVLTTFATFLLVLGQAHILGSPDPTAPDGAGIVLVTLGVVLLATVVVAGARTATAPLTGGAVFTVIGGFYLFAPAVARDQTLRLLATDASRSTVIYATVASTIGGLFVVGVLLLAGGLALVVARRRGRAAGEFRERNRTS